MTFLWTDIILFPAIFQGFLIALVLITIKKANQQNSQKINRTANYFLAALILCCTVTLLGKILYSRVSFQGMPQIGMLFDSLIFLFCPFIYLFLRKLFFYEKPTTWFLHFIPVCIYLLIVFYFLTIGTARFYSLRQTGGIWIFYYFIEGAGLITNLVYLYKSYRVIRIYSRQSTTILSFNQNVFLFLRIVILVAFLCMICWLVSFLSLGILHKQLAYINYDTMWFFVPFLTYIVGYYMLAKPTIFRIDLKENQNYSYSKQENSFEEIIDSMELLSENNEKNNQNKTRKRLTHQEIENLKQKLEIEFNLKTDFLRREFNTLRFG
ncbi:hypothetical protein ACE193_20150 [Bernardetia sp. OM2101]|uniref:hypothetical protein n=1 Tax=Bernardetia sp. OM2101 TaxID=3344876 RepID=UPI0035D070AE